MRLNIIPDDELRKEVKNLIIGQVKKVIRDDRLINELIITAVKQEIKQSIIKKHIIEVLDDNMIATRGYYSDVLKDWVKKAIVERLVDDISKNMKVNVDVLK